VSLVSFKVYRHRHSARETILPALISAAFLVIFSAAFNVSGTTDCGAGGPFNPTPLIVNDSDWVFFVLFQPPAGYLIAIATLKLYELRAKDQSKNKLKPHPASYTSKSNSEDEGNFRRYL
jgi:hypothetical protein